MPEERPIRVLVVDDSAFMRKVVSRILEDGGLDVVGTACDGVDALERVDELQPDVITLDIEMPRMDGLTFLKVLMRRRPTPVLVLSSLTHEGAMVTLEALEIGAYDFVHKPSGSVSLDIGKVGEEILAKARAAARADRGRLRTARIQAPVARPAASGSLIARVSATLRKRDAVVVIASSTGGPAALREVLPRFPGDLPAAIVIVQHLPAGFTKPLAERLDLASAVSVREAAAGDELQPGVALIAPAGTHMSLDNRCRIELQNTPPIWGVRPAADVTLKSVAALFGDRVVVAVLTGMGRDGALGACAVRDAGGICFAQDEASCVVFGMPGAAHKAGAISQLVPLDRIGTVVTEAVKNRMMGGDSNVRRAAGAVAGSTR